MRIVEVALYAVRVPLKRKFRHASAARSASDNLVARCRLADGVEGWGEGVPREYVTGETVAGAFRQLAATPLAEQLAADCTTWDDAIALCEGIRLERPPDDPRGCHGNALRCAIELAILDAFGRLFGEPLSTVTQRFGPAGDIAASLRHVRYSATIGADDARREAMSALKMRLYGFAQCKVKVGAAGADDAERLRRIRRWIGPRVDLRLDANEAWRVEELAEKLRPLVECNISCIEQPVPHCQIAQLAKFRGQGSVPVMLDESLASLDDARRAIELRACDLFNIRLSKCGGFLNSLRIAALAREAGLGYQLGCHPGETGILSAAGRHWAASVRGIRYLEGSYDRHLLKELLTNEDITFGYGGRAPALSGPGLGVTINRAALERMTTRREVFRINVSGTLRVPFAIGTRSVPDTVKAKANGTRSVPDTLAPRIVHATLPDGYRAAARVWDVARPAARVVFVHGIISHGGWYLASCRHLAQAGYEVHFLDRRGSGLNAAERGDAIDYRTWLDDLASYLEALPADVPRVLLGVSWGGKLAAALAKHRPDLIAAFGMLCPGLYAKQMPRAAQRGVLRLAAAVGLGKKRVTIPLQCPALFTESPRWQAYIRDDPLTLRRVTVRFALAEARLTRLARTRPEEIKTPGLLMLAGRDRIVENRQTLAFFERLASDRKQAIEYPEAGHTLEFEPVAEQYFADLCRWIGQVASA